MKLKNILTGSLAGVLLLGSLSACTDLTETVYDQIMSTNYYNTKDDIIKATFRPFEHGFYSIGPRQVLQECCADQLGTWARDGWWYDNAKWQYLHYHTWAADNESIKSEWENCFTGMTVAWMQHQSGLSGNYIVAFTAAGETAGRCVFPGRKGKTAGDPGGASLWNEYRSTGYGAADPYVWAAFLSVCRPVFRPCGKMEE